MRWLTLVFVSIVFFCCNVFAQINPQQSSAKTYQTMRDLAFSVSREELKLPQPNEASEPFGVILEEILDNGSYTLVAFANGDSSIYFSNGGGVIGGGNYEKTRKAARELVEYAIQNKKTISATTDSALRSKKVITFYFRTDKENSKISTSLAELESNSQLKHLYLLANNLIAELRILDQNHDH